MTQDHVRESTLSIESSENARVGYQAAVALWISEGQQIWARFNAMLVVHSILIASSGLVLANLAARPLSIVLPIAGMFICALSFILMKRDFEFQSYLIYAARELEEIYLSPVQVVSRGGHFVHGEPVQVTIGGQPRIRQMSQVSRVMRDRSITYLTSGVFAVIYLALLVMALL